MNKKYFFLLLSLVLQFAGCYFDTGSGGGSGMTVLEMPYPDRLMKLMPAGAKITFTSADASAVILTAVTSDINSDDPFSWDNSNVMTLSNTGIKKIFANCARSGSADSGIFSAVITVVNSFPPAASSAGTEAIYKDDISFVSWASDYRDYIPGTDLDVAWKTPLKALFKAEGGADTIVSLGNGGSITLMFPNPVINGDGFDFAVFENSFSDYFLELAYVEVSSDGIIFERFDNISLTVSPVDAFGTIDPSNIYGLAGTYRQGYGTPFDLEYLKHKSSVISGLVDLNNIRYIRIVDIIGGGSMRDSFNNPVYDPYPVTGSSGFDLDAVGVINERY